MMILLVSWLPANAALAHYEFTEAGAPILNLEDHSVFLSAQWMTGNVNIYGLCGHSALPSPPPARVVRMVIDFKMPLARSARPSKVIPLF
jgi:hypothetical protein